MNIFEQSRPGRQTMQNVKPSDYVPFEHTPAPSVIAPNASFAGQPASY